MIRATQNYDASDLHNGRTPYCLLVLMKSSSHYVGITTTVGGLALTATHEKTRRRTAADTAENELSLSYTMGALTVAYAKDTGKVASLVTKPKRHNITYDLGGYTLLAKGNDQDETEVSAAFSF